MDKIHLVLDWDGVVWNSDQYKIDLAERLAQYSDQDFTDLYKSSFDHNGFNDELLARHIVGGDVDFRRAVDIVDSRLSSYVYPDAKEFITEFKNRQLGRISILTAGNPNFQRKKVDQSNLATFFTDIYTVPYNNLSHDSRDRIAEAKTGLLPAMRYKGEPLVFIDDSLGTISLASETHRQRGVTLVHLDRHSSIKETFPHTLWHQLDIETLESIFD